MDDPEHNLFTKKYHEAFFTERRRQLREQIVIEASQIAITDGRQKEFHRERLSRLEQERNKMPE